MHMYHSWPIFSRMFTSAQLDAASNSGNWRLCSGRRAL